MGVNVKSFGAVGNGIVDDTLAFQQAVDYVRNAIITSSFNTPTTHVIIPSGIYKISSKITISPFVHLSTSGFVRIESYVSNNSTLHFTAQSTDPDFSSIMDRQQYLRSPLINGSKGGMYIKSMLDKTTSLSTGLEIGSTTNLGSTKPTSRYAVTDVAIGGFDVALQLNSFNNYIGSFERLHLETNNTLVKYGKTVGSVTNSGENFSYRNCVFANAAIGFNWLTDGMDSNFFGCSFDYIDALFYLQRGYKRIFVSGGHLEGIGRTLTGLRGIATSVIPGGDLEAVLILQSPVILCEENNQFSGTKLIVHCYSVRWEKITKRLNEDQAWMFNGAVTCKDNNSLYQGFNPSISRNLNIIPNSTFYLTDTSAGDVTGDPAGWTVTKSGMASAVITQSIPTSTSGNYTKALKLTGATSATNTYYTLETPNFISVTPGDNLLYNLAVYTNSVSNGTTNISFAVRVGYYDASGNLLSYSNDFADNVGIVANAWQVLTPTRVIVPKNCTQIKVRYTAAALNNTTTVYLTDLHLNRA
jgi:hypothetical protein